MPEVIPNNGGPLYGIGEWHPLPLYLFVKRFCVAGMKLFVEERLFDWHVFGACGAGQRRKPDPIEEEEEPSLTCGQRIDVRIFPF